MKSSGQLRRTPMPARRTRLQPGEKGLTSGGQLQRRKRLEPGDNPLRRVTPLARRADLKDAPKKSKRPRDTGPSKDVKDFLRTVRAKGRCERCCAGGRLDVHHRRARKAGGTKRPEINSPENLLVLCRSCHHAITNTNGHRADYEFEGLVIREDLRDSADVKVLLAGGWFLLDSSGEKKPTTPPERIAC